MVGRNAGERDNRGRHGWAKQVSLVPPLLVMQWLPPPDGKAAQPAHSPAAAKHALEPFERGIGMAARAAS